MTLKPIVFGFLMLLGCAGQKAGGTATPDTPEDPCRDATFMETMWSGTGDRDARCRAHTQAQEQELARQTLAAAAARQQAETERIKAEQTRLYEETMREEREEEEYVRELQAQAEQKRYTEILAIRECSADWEEDLQRYHLLARHERTEDRDKAIMVLEGCRKKFVKRLQRQMPTLLKSSRQTFATNREDLFDEANPYRQGALVAKVEGTVLRIRLRGNFEGRARHSQHQVEVWCSYETAAFFTKITLKNGHGTFSCVPPARVSKKQLLAKLIASYGAHEPLSTEVGPSAPASNSASGGNPFTEE